MTFFNDMAMLFSRYNSFYVEGVRNTLIISAFSVLIGIVLGTLLAMLRMSKLLPLRLIATAYIEFIRGTPLMVQLMFIFYGLPMIGVTFPDIPFIPDFSRFAAGIVAMSINSCAYVQAMRDVVLPQAIRNILPALGNEYVVVIKESSIVSVIGIADLMFRTKDVIAVTYRTLASLAIVAIIYFCMTFLGSQLIAWMERRMSHGRG